MVTTSSWAEAAGCAGEGVGFGSGLAGSGGDGAREIRAAAAARLTGSVCVVLKGTN